MKKKKKEEELAYNETLTSHRPEVVCNLCGVTLSYTYLVLACCNIAAMGHRRLLIRVHCLSLSNVILNLESHLTVLM